ncbi:MAG: Npun_F0494 family protein [Cyanophyceae cyanobacterium]
MSSAKQSISYSPATLSRAKRALGCAPFRLGLFVAMRNESVPLQEIAAESRMGQYTRLTLSEGQIERELGWLIKVGVLRREVDGQGITDSFRLTPLGRKLVETWEPQGEIPPPSRQERFRNLWNRWLRGLP